MTSRILAGVGALFLAAGVAWFFIEADEPETNVEAAEKAKKDQSVWQTDMKKAQKLAAKEGKDLLINFTGSDWCGWCIKLKNEVFKKEEFEKAGENFILVEMDFPQDKSGIPPAIQEQNQAWSQKLSIEGFPTIVLTDHQGRPYGNTGYVEGGPAAFLAVLEKNRDSRVLRDEKLSKAKSAKGLEKAKLLASALEAVPENYHLPAYRDEIDQIIALDAEDQGGLKSRFEQAVHEADARKRLKEISSDLQVAFQDGGIDAALAIVETELKADKTLANPVLKKQLAQLELQIMLKKAQDLIGEEKMQEAEKVFAAALKKTEKGTDNWLMVQVAHADLAKSAKQVKQAAEIYDEILTAKTLKPEQKAMVLIFAAEAYHEAKQEKETADRVAKADKLLEELGKGLELPPQTIAHLKQRLDAVRKKDDAEKTETQEPDKEEAKETPAPKK